MRRPDKTPVWILGVFGFGAAGMVSVGVIDTITGRFGGAAELWRTFPWHTSPREVTGQVLGILSPTLSSKPLALALIGESPFPPLVFMGGFLQCISVVLFYIHIEPLLLDWEIAEGSV